jgi:hypothetical protein
VVAFMGYFAARLFVDFWLRERLVAPAKATWSVSGRQPADFLNAWVIREGPSDRLGHALPHLARCQGLVAPHVKGIDPQCVINSRTGFTHAVYEPLGRFWLLQGIETTLFAAVAVALIALAAWWTHERVA